MKNIRNLEHLLLEKNREVELLKNKLKEKEETFDKHEKLLHSLVEAAAGKIGQDFFDNIVVNLSKWLGTDCVLIGQIVGKERIKAVPLYLDGNISHDFSYDLEGTPCAVTSRKGYCEYPENVIELFPKDKILVDLNAQGYIGTALYNNEGKINGVICAVSRNKLEIPPYARDIMKIIGARVSAEIERLKTEKELKRSEAALKASNATKDKLFSIIAHDLKNPFNSLLGFLDLMLSNLEKYDIQKQKRLLKVMNESANNTYNLLENLLSWALSQRDIISYNPEVIQLDSIVNDSFKVFQSLAGEKNIALISDVSKFFKVKADKNMLLTILRNLLSNAIKFTASGGNVEVIAARSANGNNIEISVKDTGMGMDPARIEQLFQIDKTYTEQGTAGEKGTGLGLIICKDFVERNGGKIRVKSRPGQGSTFTFTLEAF